MNFYSIWQSADRVLSRCVRGLFSSSWIFLPNQWRHLSLKLTLIFIVNLCLQANAVAIAQKITLSEKGAPLGKVLASIRQQSGYLFFYNEDWMKQAKPVDVQIKAASLDAALKAVFNNQPFYYEILDKTISIKLKPVIRQLPDEIKVTGRVTDSTGIPLPSATITVMGRSIATSTDGDGNFSIKANKGDKIMVSFIGFNSYIFPVAASMPPLAIVLRGNTGNLQEVTVTVSNGYQTISKERSAGAFAKPDKALVDNRTTSMNILQRLDGLVPGLTVNNAPNQQQYLVRGQTSISINTSPLIVVDGVPVSEVPPILNQLQTPLQAILATINPQDVADITVLKDATAASIWGAKAANGVIVITTKRGNKDGKLSINYDAFVNFQGKPNTNYFPTLNSQQFIQAVRETFDPVAAPYSAVSLPSGGSGLAPHEVILYNQVRGLTTAAQTNASLDSLAAIDNKGQIKDLFYRNAFLMNHTLSVSGGQKSYAFYGSLAYTDTRNNSPGQSNDTYKINLRQDFSIGKRIQLNLITDLTNNVTNNLRNLTPTSQFYPYQLFQDASGQNISMPYMTALSDGTRLDYEARSRINLNYNPLDEVNRGYNRADYLLSRNVLGARVKLLEGLNFEGNYGFIRGTTRTKDFSDGSSYGVRAQVVQFTVAPTLTSTPVYYLPTTGGNYTINNLNQRNWTIRNQLTYNKDWNNNLHQLNVLVGQEAREQQSTTNLSRIKGWNPQLQAGSLIDYRALQGGIANTVYPTSGSSSSLTNEPFFYEGETISRFNSYYSNIGYTYDQKYTINGSFRVDQSNNFGLDQAAQSKPVYAIGAKWLLSRESFMDKVKWVNNLALRGTYGLTGNAPDPGTAASYDILTSVTSSLPGGLGLNISTPANRKLTWERTTTLNLGLDFSLFQSRISGSLDVYQKKTTDLLGNVPTNTFTGFPAILGNLGDLENKGVELALTTLNITGNNFRWSTTLIGAYNKNIITNLNISTPVTTGSGRVGQRYVAGYPAYALFAYQYAGLDNLGDPQIRLADGTVTKTRNISRPDDIKFMGSTQPPWTGGLSNAFSYKSFGLNINMVYNFGNVMRRDVNQFYSGRFTHLPFGINGFATGNGHAEFADRWKQAGDEQNTLIPSFIANTTASNARRDYTYYTYADMNVLSAAYVKMRDATLTYSLPKQIVQRINFEQITLRAQVSNVMLWRNNRYGIDPEFQDGVFGNRSIPINQGTFSFGLNARF